MRKPIFSILSSKRGITPTKIDRNWQHWNLICSKAKQNHMQNFSSICQSVQEKSAENCISSILRSKRGITPTEIDGNWQHWNLICSTVKKVICKISAWYIKACKRKVRKIAYSSILGSKRGITPTEIDGNWRHSNLISSTVKVKCKISAQYVKACKNKVRKTVYFQFSTFQKGHNSHKNWRKLTTLELDL